MKPAQSTNQHYQYTKAVIYCRVSSKKQTIEGSGLDSQEHRCREYAKQNGYDVEMVFTDDVSGGGDFMKRKGMVALLDFLRRRRKTNYVVIFDDLKRFARDTLFHLQLRAEMDKYRAKIECLNFKFEDTPEGQFVEIIHAAQGELERRQNGRQTQQKMRARLEQGYFVFNAPIGYRYEKTKEHGKLLVPNEPFAAVIKEGLLGFASGRFQSQAEFRRFLESVDCFPKNAYGQIAKKRSMDILTHPVYAGCVEHERWGIGFRKAKHEGLISVETYQKIQDRIAGRANAPARKDLNKEFPLRGFVVCASCGNPLTAGFTKGKTKLHPYYVCQKRGCSSRGKSIRRAQLEGDFENILKQASPKPQLASAAMDMLKTLWGHQESLKMDERKRLKAQLKETDQKIEKAMDLLLESSHPNIAQNLEKRIAQMEREKVVLTEKLKNIGQPLRPLRSISRTSLDFLANPHRIWASERLEDKRAVLKLVVSEPVAYDREEGSRTPKFALPFKHLGGNLESKNKMVPRERLELSRA
jgi:site-specific DNA recombinase